jgi:integrase
MKDSRKGSYSYERDIWTISLTEFKQMFDNTDLKQIKTFLTIIYYTGGRYDEIRQLKLNNVVIEDEYIIFFIKNAKRKDNSRRELKIPIGMPYMDYVVEYIKERQLMHKIELATEHLFDFNYWFGIDELRRICKKTGNKISYHAFRKHIGTKIALKGHAAHQIRAWLGHKTPATAFYYIENSGRITESITEGFKEEIK